MKITKKLLKAIEKKDYIFIEIKDGKSSMIRIVKAIKIIDGPDSYIPSLIFRVPRQLFKAPRKRGRKPVR